MKNKEKIEPIPQTIKGSKSNWEIVIGMEVHAQIKSKAKLFSEASTNFGSEPNGNVSLARSTVSKNFSGFWLNPGAIKLIISGINNSQIIKSIKRKESNNEKIRSYLSVHWFKKIWDKYLKYEVLPK